MSDTTNITLRVSREFIDRIDEAASHHGMNRTEYVLSWLPIRYDQQPEPTAEQAAQGQRVAQSQRSSSPART